MKNTTLTKKIPKAGSFETWVKKHSFFIFQYSFKVEAELKIPMYDSQVNVEILNSWLKQLEVYFGLYQTKEAQHISFARLKMTKHALL